VFSSVPLAWLQLKHEPLRLFVALAGIAFAVILIFMQLGFNSALFESNVRVHRLLQTDLVLISPRSPYLIAMRQFPRRRVYQALGFAGVESVSAVYVGIAQWKVPETGRMRDVFVFGFDPSETVIDIPGVNSNRDKLRIPDWYLFDAAARPEYGPIASEFGSGTPVEREVANRRIYIVGLFVLGTSFGIDGALITSDLNFRRLLPNRTQGAIDIGLIRLKPGADVRAVQRALRAELPNDVEVLTKEEFMNREKAYWAQTTPIGFVFAFGSIMGLIVGGVIVYQILFTDISTHLPEYATLKAMGYTNWSLVSVVLQQAFILALLGFAPGIAVAAQLYRFTASATRLPMELSLPLAASVLGLTMLMCAVAGAIALRKVRSADPAEIF
jgi:heterocyst specific transport system permease protein